MVKGLVLEMKIGSREFDTEHHTYIMGILNVTPDSFSDGGMYNDLDKALLHAQELVRDGADILDVGGESSLTHPFPSTLTRAALQKLQFRPALLL